MSRFQQDFRDFPNSSTCDKRFHLFLPVVSHPIGRHLEGDGQKYGSVEYENGDESSGAIATHNRVDTPSGRPELGCLEGERSGKRSEGSKPKSEEYPYNIWVP